ncbi:hypothetical protein PGT21_014966 [Puccinia graminis f. sp. tritici]|uniref:Uncharacterized protein n=1 Tax=Puccinia graminis f. sp. tritici TaxID=56615 RepID=A0A5B0QN90_PUCGR|nr:hypothetical protein PGT21_014966 [Puccinia graminis f. sp. tritici]
MGRPSHLIVTGAVTSGCAHVEVLGPHRHGDSPSECHQDELVSTQSSSRNEGAPATGIALRPARVACQEHLVTKAPYRAPRSTWGLWRHWGDLTFIDSPRCVPVGTVQICIHVE